MYQDLLRKIAEEKPNYNQEEIQRWFVIQTFLKTEFMKYLIYLANYLKECRFALQMMRIGV